mmetsp:Transcript_5430/g.12504  ORF Transcript_5430/g.12504 Transcript_5430/m.12504 type:complete len:246 (+) Transcript_5430:1910-2647(+)
MLCEWRRLARPMVALTSFIWNLKPNSGTSGSIRKSPPADRRSRSMPNQRISFARECSSSFGVMSTPPSTEVRCLMACREKTHRLPCEPSGFPPNSAPKACAQSSITFGRKPYFSWHELQTRSTPQRSTGVPPQCTSMITLVVGESLRSKSAMHMLQVAGFTSTHLMRSPLARMGQLVAVQVSGQLSTSSTCGSSPGHPAARLGRLSRCSDKCSPDVAELRVSTRGLTKYSRSAASNASTFGPCVT